MASTDPPDPKRGGIWLVALGAARKREPGKTRPAIVVSVDDLAAGIPTELLVVVPLSSSRTPSPLRPTVSGLDRPTVAICRGVRAVARTRFLRQLGKADSEALLSVERALALILGLQAPPPAGDG